MQEYYLVLLDGSHPKGITGGNHDESNMFDQLPAGGPLHRIDLGSFIITLFSTSELRMTHETKFKKIKKRNRKQNHAHARNKLSISETTQ